MVRLLLVFITIIPFLCAAQGDTLYYTAGNIRTTKQDAYFFEVSHKIRDNEYETGMYFINTGHLYRTTHLSSLEPPVYEGTAVTYHPNGDTVKGTYASNAYTGDVHEYYPPELKQLWCSYSMKNGLLQGSLISYFPNGKVKRRGRYIKDNLVQSIQYDEQGKEVPYTEFNIMPEPMFSVKKYLSKNLHYPPKALKEGIEGIVNVLFLVDKDGKIREVTVPEPVHPLLDAEAIRVVNNMKQWKPGIVDDVPVKMYFTLPVSFQLTR